MFQSRLPNAGINTDGHVENPTLTNVANYWCWKQTRSTGIQFWDEKDENCRQSGRDRARWWKANIKKRDIYIYRMMIYLLMFGQNDTKAPTGDNLGDGASSTVPGLFTLRLPASDDSFGLKHDKNATSDKRSLKQHGNRAQWPKCRQGTMSALLREWTISHGQLPLAKNHRICLSFGDKLAVRPFGMRVGSQSSRTDVR